MKENIEEIKKHIEENNLSFIIGAGFSKNMSTVFPFWGELLNDMVLELYPPCFLLEENLKKIKLQQIINEKGYLGIASEYVRRKGFHEAIDIYIEKHIPYLEKQEDNYVVLCNGKVVDKKPDLTCHQKLLALGAQHIYTFNYDNALDVLAKTPETNEYICNERKLKENLATLKKMQDEYFKLSDTITSTSSFSKDMKDNKASLENINESLSLLHITLKDIFVCDNWQDDHRNNEMILKNEISKIENELEVIQEKQLSGYKLITNDYDISLTDRGKNLYKLHGNLRLKKEDKYGFDGDRHQQYIITKEDYDNYPSQHEAFVNLMRIALLKGNFCMIGFSGDDPNFLAWIKWVKDILDKKTALGDVSYLNKIFFINVDDEPLEEDKVLLLKNNYITIVDLFKIFPETSNRKERLLLFLDAIGPYSDNQQQYEILSKQLGTKYKDLPLSKEILEQIDKIYQLSDLYRFPKLNNYIESYYRRDWYECIPRMLKKQIDNDSKEALYKLYYCGVKAIIQPVDMNIADLILKDDKADTTLKQKFEVLKLRVQALDAEDLSGNALNSDEVKYEKILKCLFTLQFDSAFTEVNKWNPSRGFNALRRMFLLSLFQSKLDEIEVKSVFNACNYLSTQDYSMALDLFSQILKSPIFYDAQNKNDHFEAIRTKKRLLDETNLHLNRFWDIKRCLYNQIKKKESIEYYGDATQVINFGAKDYEQGYSTALLQLYLEVGIATELNLKVFLNKEEWLEIFANLFEKYPYPCLYFTLLYGNEKNLVINIAQQYIYSEKLRNKIPDLLKKMLLALSEQHTPKNVKFAIYLAAPVFMRAVDPNLWSQDFISLYDILEKDRHIELNLRCSKILHFMTEGIMRCLDDSFKLKVITNVLLKKEKISDNDNLLIIAATKGVDSLNTKIKTLLKELLKNVSTRPQMYVLLNMKRWLNGKDLVCKLLTMDQSFFQDPSLLEGLCKLANEVKYSDSQMSLCCLIIENRNLWQNGISKDGKSLFACERALEINDIQEMINFSESMVLKIYVLLKSSFAQMTNFYQNNCHCSIFSFVNNWNGLLMMMQVFLIKNKYILNKEKDYEVTCNQVKDFLCQYIGSDDLVYLLQRDRTVDDGLMLLINALFWGNFDNKVESAYCSLTSILITRQSSSLNSCFRHFGWALSKYNQFFNKQLFTPLLKCILNTYQQYYSTDENLSWDIKNAEKDIVEYALLHIYSVYEKWGGVDEFWKQYKPRYYVA